MTRRKSSRQKERSACPGSRSTHFDKLPETLQLRILHLLRDARDLARIAVVSKRWAWIASQAKNVALPEDMWPDSAATFLRDKGGLDCLAISHATAFEQRFPGIVLNSWSLVVPELKDLSIHFGNRVIHPGVLMAIAACFHRLQSLSLGNFAHEFRTIGGVDNIFSAPARFSYLQQLSVTGLGICWHELPGILRGCPILTEADIGIEMEEAEDEDDDEDEDETGSVPISIQHDKLKRLKLSGPRKRYSHLRIQTPSLIDLETTAFDIITAAVSPDLWRLSFCCSHLSVSPVPTRLRILSVAGNFGKKMAEVMLEILRSSQESLEVVTPTLASRYHMEFLGKAWQLLQRCPKAKRLTLYPDLVAAPLFDLSSLRALEELQIEAPSSSELFVRMDQEDLVEGVSWQRIVGQLASNCPSLRNLRLQCFVGGPNVNQVLEAQRLLKNVAIIVEADMRH